MISRLAGSLSTFLRLLSGAAFAFAVGQFCIVWISICGASTDALAALGLAAALGLMLATVVGKGLWGNSKLQAALLTVAVLVLSWTLSSMLDSALTMGVSLAGSLSISNAFAFLLPAVFAVAFFACIAAWYHKQSESLVASDVFGRFLAMVGLSLGCLLLLLHVQVLVPIAVTLSVLMSAALVIRIGQSDNTSETIEAAAEKVKLSWQAITSALGLAMFVIGAVRLNALLVPMNVPLVLVATAISLMFFQMLSMRMISKLLQQRLPMVCVVLAAVMLPLVFSGLVDVNLNWNASVSSLSALVMLRAVQFAVICCVGLTCWWMVNQILQTADTTESSSAVASLHQAAARQMPLIVLGAPVGVICAAAGMSVAAQIAGGTILILLPTILSVVAAEKRIPVWLPVTASILAIAFAATAHVDSAATAQTLFSARSANGIRLGLSPDVVAQSHCTRLVKELSSAEGQLTVWRTSGDLLELRRNGYPVGQVSINNMTSPQPLAETLTTILPLIMHRNAQSVMLLGDDAGVGLRVCCNFPVHTIEAIRPDSASTEFAMQNTWTDLLTSPLDDERVSIRHEDVATAVRTSRKAADLFDVVVASSPNPMSLSCQEQLTDEFYLNIRKQLKADGVFCQRVSQYDLGAEPLLRMLSSLTSVYGRVVVMQMAPGEMAMVASVDPETLLDEGLLSRLQRSHVTHELSRSGWDWSQVAALPVVDSSDPLGIFEYNARLATVPASSGFFAMGLPLEAARWGNKAGEVQEAFRPHQRRMADAAPRGAAYDEYARRFSAVVQQMEIQTTFHDQPWAYRNSLKIEMQRNPRPAIEEIKGGKVTRRADPRDEYRKDYFIALGQSLRQAAEGVADPLTLQNLSQFATTYEPLLSFFANYELVRIHEATSHPSPALELQHRLHTVYFTDGRDYSIRQIVAAIKQIVEDPELLASDEARFDHTNSLLQELVRRWEGRRGYEPPSARKTQRDLDLCIRTTNEAMDAMEDWCDAVKMTRPDFLARRKFINRALLSPLRDYREQVLAHRIKTENSLAGQALDEDDGELPMLIDQSDLMTN